MKNANTVTIDNVIVPIEGEKNLLELVRKAKIDLPTFCYLSEMSVYGACRLCMVDIEGRGLNPACSTAPLPGMIVRTNTQELRHMRKMIVELLLASHQGECPTCGKSGDCQLQSLARKAGVTDVRFKRASTLKPIDKTSVSLWRDPNKCVLCGDCVRMCSEIQGVNAIDFAYRGSSVVVAPCFNKGLGQIECINCGQCARVCPTGAIIPKPDIEEVWSALQDKNKVVVAQIAPAVRAALGEAFGYKAGTLTIGNIVAALKRMGFNKIYDTSFTADLTIFEEATEFITRFTTGGKLPLFTSCCPAWVKFAEQYYPEYLSNISTCRSPQQMLGSIVKNAAAAENVDPKNVVMVSIMPCTAKKAEAAKEEFKAAYGKDVDYVLTTRELATMINEAGLNFKELELESFDMPYGYKTGAGVIFGNSGGVTEAVIRYAAEKLTGVKSEEFVVPGVRGSGGIKEYNAEIGGITIRIAVVSGLKNARALMDSIIKGEKQYDFVEVMACPGGCVNGGGQPCYIESTVKKDRTEALYGNDLMLQLHKPQENPYISMLYDTVLGGKPNSAEAHKLLHTHYKSHKRTEGADVPLSENPAPDAVEVAICFGTSCFVRGAQTLLKELTDYIDKNELNRKVNIKATFCLERCDKGPVIRVGGKIIEKCTLEKAVQEIGRQIK
jgi:NADH-quinone oxidoreductase subunit G